MVILLVYIKRIFSSVKLLVQIKRELGDAEVNLNKSLIEPLFELIESLFERVSRTCYVIIMTYCYGQLVEAECSFCFSIFRLSV
jgi:hypothetical protein